MKYKKTIAVFIGIVLMALVGYAGFGWYDNFVYEKIAKEVKAGSAIPFVGASNRILSVTKCLPDPPPTPYTCQLSCPLLTPLLVAGCLGEIGAAQSCLVANQNDVARCAGPIAAALACSQCNQYFEINITGTAQIVTAALTAEEKNDFTAAIAAPGVVPVLGLPATALSLIRGPFPMPGGQIIYAGSSNVIPWVVGTSGPATSFWERFGDWVIFQAAALIK